MWQRQLMNTFAACLWGSAMMTATFAPSLYAATTPIKIPDITGPWQIEATTKSLQTSDGKAPPLLPDSQKVYEQYLAARSSGDTSFDPVTKCLPPGVPRLMMQARPFNIIQGNKLYGMVFEWNHLHRVIYMNQMHFEPIGPLYLGQSIGHWEGNTLVVDTNNYNDTTLLDDSGIPHSDALHTIERIRLVDDNTLENRIQIEDPNTFSKPWAAVLRFKKRPAVLIAEDYCLGRAGHGSVAVK